MMFLCKVVMGRAMETTECELQGLPPLPMGFESLHAKAAPGGLNYDEVVVYSQQAAIPSWLIVYSL